MFFYYAQDNKLSEIATWVADGGEALIDSGKDMLVASPEAVVRVQEYDGFWYVQFADGGERRFSTDANVKVYNLI